MTCKCKKEMVAFKLGLNYHKSVLFHYCSYCGRIYFYGTDIKGGWLESLKSINSNLIERYKIRDMLKDLYPKTKSSSVKYKNTIEILDKILQKIEEIKPF